MTNNADDTKLDSVPIGSSLIGMKKASDSAASSDQLDDRTVGVTVGHGIEPPYDPGRLAALQELNGTHAVCVSKKAHREVGYGFDLVPHDRVDESDASDDEHERADEFWFGRSTKWSLGPAGTAAGTPTEIFEKARQDYYGIGWLGIEILYAGYDDEPAGLSYIPAKTLRKTRGSKERTAGHGYVQLKNGQTVFLAEAGDRRAEDLDGNPDPTYVDKHTGDTYDSREHLESASGAEPANEVLFIPNPHPNADYYGLPTWISEIQTMVADQEARRYNRKRLENDLILDYAIIVEGGYLSDEAREKVREHIRGMRESDTPSAWILEAEDLADKGYDVDENVSIRIEPMSQAGDQDLSFADFRDRNEHDIAKVHSVPRQLLDRHDATNSNTEEAIRNFMQDFVKPAQQRFQQRLYSIIHQRILDVHDWTIQFTTHGSKDRMREAEVAHTKVEAADGAITVNEVREMLELDPLDPPIGDTLMSELGGDEGGAGEMVEQMIDEAREEGREEGMRQGRINYMAETASADD